ncbi:GNAT family N-acetyltransferase [Streptomyces sp. SID14478]|nr:GNAT family N-acetyltransferase [Streptomyces sp. SID14478]
MDIRVETVREADRALVDAFDRLLPQLSSTAEPLDREALDRMVTCDATTVLVARTPDAIVGTLTLVLLPLPSGVRARVEDVVVDGAARGRGVAALLTEEALRIAREAGARTVDLTSRPDRAAANRLYERLGFRARQSTVYRYAMDAVDAGGAGDARGGRGGRGGRDLQDARDAGSVR